MVLIWFLSKFFPETLNKAYHKRSRASWKSRAEFVFEVEGKSYYRFTKVEDVPLPRLEALQMVMIAMDNRLTYSELETLTTGALEKIEQGMAGQKGALADAIFLMREILERKKVLHMHPEILLDIVATTCIREDEKLGSIDPVIHKQKMELFRERFDEIGFFLGSGLKEFLPKLGDSPEAFKHLLKMHQREIERRNSAMLSVVRGGTKSKNTK
jgi:hypothetical protein